MIEKCTPKTSDSGQYNNTLRVIIIVLSGGGGPTSSSRVYASGTLLLFSMTSYMVGCVSEGLSSSLWPLDNKCNAEHRVH